MISDSEFSYGHCLENKKPGGCQLHNLQCGYPECDRKPLFLECPHCHGTGQPNGIKGGPEHGLCGYCSGTGEVING